MKYRWMVTLPLLAGCSAFERQQATLDELGRDMRLVRDQVQTAQASVDALAANQIDQQTTRTLIQSQSSAIALQIDQLSSIVAGLPDIVDAACERYASTPEPVCEADDTVRTVVTSDDKILVGELERIWVDPPGMTMVARIDTGAQSSSLTAENIVEFERDGDDWVRFDVVIEDRSTTLEREVVRYVRVVQQADPEGTRRPVVSMRLLLGNVQDSFEFTLADRSHLDYQSILGRNFLTDLALVDVGRQFVQPAFEPAD